MSEKHEPIVIKKYANRRLYNTGSSTYVTLEDLADMVKAGDDFVVQEAKSGEDITRSVLTQIIFEQENKDGQNMLPTDFLRQLISFYGDSMQNVVPSYLEISMKSLTAEQEKFREQMASAVGANMGANLSGNPFVGQMPNALEDYVRQNMEMFQKTMAMFTPFGAPATATQSAQPKEEPNPPPEGDNSGTNDIESLQEELAAMQARLAKLAGKS